MARNAVQVFKDLIGDLGAQLALALARAETAEAKVAELLREREVSKEKEAPHGQSVQ